MSNLSSVLKKSKINRHSRYGNIYRTDFKPVSRPKIIDKEFTVRKLLNQNYKLLPKRSDKYEYVKLDKEDNVPIAKLSHGLEKALFYPGVHRMRDPVTNRLNFPSYLEKLHHPDTIDYSKMPPFKTPSADEKLHSIALAKGARFKGSTSSISGSLSQLYFLISNFRDVDVDNLSHIFQRQTRKFTPSQKLPTSFVLHPKDGIYAIDRFQPSANTNILSSIGKSVERMITMEKEEFESVFLKSSKSSKTLANEKEAFNYLQAGNLILRSQLDCVHDEIGIFDLKTRATFPLRVYSHEDLPKLLNYKLDRLRGSRNSFEREYYDMARSSFLRNSFQTRIGNMSGIFIVYHNTDEVFGFEYLKREELERAIYQSPNMAEYVYNTTLIIFDELLNTITQGYDPNVPLNVILHSSLNSNNDATMSVFVHEAKFNENNELMLPKRNEPIESLKMFKVDAHTAIEDYVLKGPLHIDNDDDPSAYLKISQITGSKALQTVLYHKTIDQWVEFYTKNEKRRRF